uniref:SMCHD1 ribosomal S5 domain-containing protein n=1 Tax=Auxenochlorella protothecoides TaxID=3075 RepID=A0A1D2ABE5_AUXPR
MIESSSIQIVHGTLPALEVLLPAPALPELVARVSQHFRLGNQEFHLTDFTRPLESDVDLRAVPADTILHVMGHSGALAAPGQETVSFQPHPKTLTMAGDYEYFAAQGKHPFVYALAEFVDNSLRATSRASEPRNITISFVLNSSSLSSAKGLVCIQDTGCGMTKRDLNDWAVMNYSMEERGQLSQPSISASPTKYLNSNISYFGVGSKNAAFFIGSSVKMVTRRVGEPYVHELQLSAGELEQRYRLGQAVYETVMIHRRPGDALTQAPWEQAFPITQQWVGEEATGSEASGFTRVLLGGLKPEVLHQMLEEGADSRICRELAHLYHFYIHGEGGNRGPGSSGRPSPAPACPTISIQCIIGDRILWHRSLHEVDDDLESRMLRGQQAELGFSLHVPDRGIVWGVLYYFPFQDGAETVPLEGPSAGPRPDAGPGMTQQYGVNPSQAPTQSLAPMAAAGSLALQADLEVGASDDDTDGPWMAPPIFEVFWQGRLIPGAKVDTLPFLEALRTKRNAAAKDVLPDQAFLRLRGSLFLGPAFQVTRNKLLLRDDLRALLLRAVPGDRSLGRRAREWLAACHARLDKVLRFLDPADTRLQAHMREELGEACTAFLRVDDGGGRSLRAGDVVRLDTRPAHLGRLACFTVPAPGAAPGCHAGGRAHVELLPADVFGAGCLRGFPLRRLRWETVPEGEQVEHAQRELGKVPACLRLEPLKLAARGGLRCVAGDTLPDTQVLVVSGSGQRLTRVLLGGSRQTLKVTQTLWRLAKSATPAQAPASPPPLGPAQREAGGKRWRRRRGAGPLQEADENRPPVVNEAEVAEVVAVPATQDRELVLQVENHSPVKDAYYFSRLANGLTLAGQYVLEYTVSPCAPGGPQGPPVLQIHVAVSPGAPTQLCLGGEGVAAAALRPLAFGEALPPITVLLADQHGNTLAPGPGDDHALPQPALRLLAGDGEAELPVELESSCSRDQDPLRIVDLVAVPRQSGLLEAQAPGSPDAPVQGGQGAGALPRTLDGVLEVCVASGGAPGLTARLPLRLRSGPPITLSLLPPHPWEGLGEGAGLEVTAGATLPGFEVQAWDAWGNRSPALPGLEAAVRLAGPCCSDAPAAAAVFPLDDDGAATIADVALTCAPGTAGQAQELELRLEASAATPTLEAALVRCRAGHDAEAPALGCPVVVHHSLAPASLALELHGEALQRRPDPRGTGPDLLLLPGLPAGSSLPGLRLALLDGGGGRVERSVAGRVTVSWHRGSKRLAWKGEAVRLPTLPVPETATALGEASVLDAAGDLNAAGAQDATTASTEWVRFASDDGTLLLEVGLFLGVVPGPPKAWALSLVEGEAGEASQEGGEGVGAVRCGQPFALEIEALDAHNNRCARGEGAPLPTPVLEPEAEGHLGFDPASWECGWMTATQGVAPVYSVKMSLLGAPGTVRLTVRSGEEGAGADMAPDSLTLQLAAGPPARLVFSTPGPLHCGLAAVLPSLRVSVADRAGNPAVWTSGATLDVSLAGSALASDGGGRAASVSARGGNKARAKAGAAAFAEVALRADVPGSYTLRAVSSSRRVALEDATLELVMRPRNLVASLEVAAVGGETVSTTGAAPPRVAWGAAAVAVAVRVTTEDGEPLPAAAAAAGLCLRVSGPGAARPQRVGPCADQADPGLMAFLLEGLVAAGEWTLAAEYVETRPELLDGLSRKASELRSPSCCLLVDPGALAGLDVEAASLPDLLTATNGTSTRQRMLLRSAAVQLLDEAGNSVPTAGVPVRFALRWGADGRGGDAGEPPEGAALPSLTSSLGALGACETETDAAGRAALGDLSIEEGSGSGGGGAAALALELVAQAQGLELPPGSDGDPPSDQWVTAWSIPLLFTDHAAKASALAELNARREAVLERQDAHRRKLDAAREAARARQGLLEEAEAVLAQRQETLQGLALDSLAAGEAALEAARQAHAENQAAVLSGSHPRQARFGPAKQPMAASIRRLLASGDPGLVGVVAEAATIEHAPLARIASAQFRSLLDVVVVTDMAARARLVAALADTPAVPDMLAQSHTAQYRGPTQGDIPGFHAAGELARALVASASAGTDPPLPVPLPHTKAAARGAPAEAGIIPVWPPGCLGYLFNLVRPCTPGTRAALLHGLFGPALVFESLESAAAYRELVVRRLRGGVSDIVTLDCRRITGRGIVSGSGFNVPPLERAEWRFGSLGGGQEAQAAVAVAAGRVAALERWLTARQELQRARDAFEEGRGALRAAEDECAAAQEPLAAELDQLGTQLGTVEIATQPRGTRRDAGERVEETAAAARPRKRRR